MQKKILIFFIFELVEIYEIAIWKYTTNHWANSFSEHFPNISLNH